MSMADETVSSVCSNIVGWFPPPHGYAELVERFESLQVLNGQVRTPGWERRYMISVGDLPMLGRGLYVNKAIVPMLRAALETCQELETGYQLASISCFAPRIKRSNGELSTHSWGIAVDINPDSNPPLRIRTVADIARKHKEIPDEWVNAFKSIGWTWGGDFTSYYDPMHFQWCSGY